MPGRFDLDAPTPITSINVGRGTNDLDVSVETILGQLPQPGGAAVETASLPADVGLEHDAMALGDLLDGDPFTSPLIGPDANTTVWRGDAATTGPPSEPFFTQGPGGGVDLIDPPGAGVGDGGAGGAWTSWPSDGPGASDGRYVADPGPPTEYEETDEWDEGALPGATPPPFFNTPDAVPPRQLFVPDPGPDTTTFPMGSSLSTPPAFPVPPGVPSQDLLLGGDPGGPPVVPGGDDALLGSGGAPVVAPPSTWRTVTVVVIVLFLVMTGYVVVTGIGAGESLPATLTGPCAGSATVQDGPTIDPAVSGGVYTLPLQGSARYRGEVRGVAEGPREQANGSVWVVTPPLFPSIPVGGGWPSAGDTITGVSSEGNQSWNVPTWVPRGVVFTVAGEHVDVGGIHCKGRVALVFEGAVTESPLWIVPWVLVVVVLLLLLVAARNRASRRRSGLPPRGHPVLGVVAGAVLGLAVALGLTLTGVQPLDGPAATGLLPLGVVLGLSLAMWAPLGRST